MPEVQCVVTFSKMTHTYAKDGRVTYAMPGVCWGTATDRVNRQVNFHVDAVWIPAEEIAHETGRIFDLGSIGPCFSGEAPRYSLTATSAKVAIPG